MMAVRLSSALNERGYNHTSCDFSVAAISDHPSSALTERGYNSTLCKCPVAAASGRQSSALNGRGCKYYLSRLTFFFAILLTTNPSLAMSSDEQLLFANGLYRRGLFESAIPEYQSILKNDAATNMHDVAAFRIAECQLELGHTNEAISAFDAVIDQYPNSTFFHRAGFRRAELDWSSGRLKDAAKRFQQVLDRKPPEDIEAAAYYFLGICNFGLDRFEPAENNLRRTLRDHPASPYADYARIALADLIIQQGGSTSEAVELLKKVADKPETPLLGAEATAKSGQLAYREKRMDEASSWYLELAKKYGDSTWFQQTRLDATWAHLLSGNTEMARKYAAEGLASSSTKDQPAWLYVSANIDRQDQKLDRAMEFYDRLIESFPGHELAASAAFEACGLAWQSSDFERVLALCDLAQGPAENTLPILWMKAGSLRGTGKNDDAATVYETILRDFPDSNRAPASAYQLALFAAENGDHARAAEAFASIAKSYTNSSIAPDALMAAASTYFRAGDESNAADNWRELVKTYPDYPGIADAYMGLARVEVKNDKIKPAADALEKLLALPDNNPLKAEANYLRGTLYEKEEKFDDAEHSYQQSLKNKPQPSLVRQVQYRRVAVLQRQGRSGDAAELMNSLIAEGASDQLPPSLLEWLARWNLENKKYPEAEKAGLRLANSGDTPAWKQLGYFIAGTAAREQKKIKSATLAFESAASLGLNTRETADSLYQLGLIDLDQNKPEAALDHFSRSAEYASTDSMMDIRARCYLQLGIANEALQQWAEAGRYYLGVGVLFDDPTLTPESLYRAAGALHAQQQNAERNRVLAELRERFPDNEWTKRADERWSATTGQ